MPDARVAVATQRGLYLLESDSRRQSWHRSGPFLESESVNRVSRGGDGSLYASTLTEGVFRSKDGGKTWGPASRGLHVRKVWTVESEVGDPGSLYAGTQYGHLFHSGDSGDSWDEVTGLHKAPEREKWGIDWGFGTVGLTVHTIRSEPTGSGRLYIVSSGAGTYSTDDGGKEWKLLRSGVDDGCPVSGGRATVAGQDSPSEHLRMVHRCTHKLAMSKRSRGVIFQQNHCGVYASKDGGEHWDDISPGDDRRHGFPIAYTEGGTLFVVPAYQGICKEHNSCVKGQLAVMRSPDGGRSWEEVKKGLPAKVHCCVLRDGMSEDGLEEPGVYLGTTTGEVYASFDGGDSWKALLSGVGRIQGITSFGA
ncbi:MAG: exo-alpha-sialidase [Nitrososphaerota archaeon]|nr:exo-alpha-sialidase [Nitrososphaerota archaeon]